MSKYFDSIDHKILLATIKKKIVDGKTLRLIEEIINSNYSKKVFENLFDYKLAGIPIGNLTSQLFANIYLNELDQFLKHKLREKFYIRYMDDFLILSHDKKMLHNLKQTIKEFLSEKLALTLHPKKANIFPVSAGIDFLGYRIFVSDIMDHRLGGETYRLLRKSTVKRFIKRTKIYQKMLNKKLLGEEKFNNSLQSWTAYAKFANSYKLRKNLSEKLKVNLIK